MLERLGNVLYWTGTSFAALIVVGAALVAFSDSSISKPLFIGAGGIVAAGVWLCGRACRYVLAGR